ncbi:hypothetical protein RB599_006160 [Gaeumannomyces hyphopodioides]
MIEPVAHAKGKRPWFEADLAQFLESGSDFNIMRRLQCHVTSRELGHVLPPAGLERVYSCRRVHGPERILVLDSSFNPPTKAHRQMAIEALLHSGWRQTRLLLVLSVNNADKAAKPAAFQERWAMMGLLARDLALYFWELQQQAYRQDAVGRPNPDEARFGIDMALTTLPYFHQKSEALAAAEPDVFLPRQPNSDQRAQQVILVGFDTFTRILDPKYYPPRQIDEVLGPMFERATLRVTLRADASAVDIWEQRRHVSAVRMGRDCEWMRWAWRENIVVAEEAHMALGAETDISSTRARAAAAQQDWALLATQVPPTVAQWIQERGLYGEESQGSTFSSEIPAIRTEGISALYSQENPTWYIDDNLAFHNEVGPVLTNEASPAFSSETSPALRSDESPAFYGSPALFIEGSPGWDSEGNRGSHGENPGLHIRGNRALQSQTPALCNETPESFNETPVLSSESPQSIFDWSPSPEDFDSIDTSMFFSETPALSSESQSIFDWGPAPEDFDSIETPTFFNETPALFSEPPPAIFDSNEAPAFFSEEPPGSTWTRE